jgi:uncharacterized protein YoxC
MIKCVNFLKESVNVINESNKKFSEFLAETASKNRTTSEEIGQLKVVMIIVYEKISSVSITLDVHETSIHQLTTLVHGRILSIMKHLINSFFIDEQG